MKKTTLFLLTSIICFSALPYTGYGFSGYNSTKNTLSTTRNPSIQTETTDDDKNDKEKDIKPDVYPQFPGGTDSLTNYLRNNIRYPDIAKDNLIQARVIISFIINKEGQLINPSVLRTTSSTYELIKQLESQEQAPTTIKHIETLKSGLKALEDEAIRVIESMPTWKAGMKNNEPVNVKEALPINFKME